MPSRITLLCFLTLTAALHAQTTADFENFGLSPGEFLNGSDGSGGFRSGNVFLPNDYNEEFESWSGWAISATTDTETPGFTNQYSAITGGGAEGSDTYALAFASGGSTVMELEGEAAGGAVEGLFVTNSTYAALAMANGDMFAKKFGGESGDDPDFFLLTVKAYRNGELSTDSVDLYLADYRFEDNSQDYILQEWTYLDLTSLGNADSLLFSLTSTDVGQFGINTPTYFCIDNLTTADMISNTRELPASSLSVFPNPATEAWQVDWRLAGQASAQLFDAQGRLIRRLRLQRGNNRIEAAGLSSGLYFLRLENEDGFLSQPLLKQ